MQKILDFFKRIFSFSLFSFNVLDLLKYNCISKIEEVIQIPRDIKINKNDITLEKYLEYLIKITSVKSIIQYPYVLIYPENNKIKTIMVDLMNMHVEVFDHIVVLNRWKQFVRLRKDVKLYFFDTCIFKGLNYIVVADDENIALITDYMLQPKYYKIPKMENSVIKNIGIDIIDNIVTISITYMSEYQIVTKYYSIDKFNLIKTKNADIFGNVYTIV